MAYTDKNKLRVVYGDYTLGVHGDGFDYIFSYSQGGLESIVKTVMNGCIVVQSLLLESINR